MKKLNVLTRMLLLVALLVGSVSVWAEDITYTFTSKSWAATAGGSTANWTNGAEGNGYASGQGIQVTTGTTGANGTSPASFTNISQIVVTYNTNKSAGAGSIDVKIGNNTETSNDVAYSGSSDGRTADFTTTFSYVTAQTGNVKITVNTTTNSIWIKSVKITYSGSSVATPTILPAAGAVEKGTTVTITTDTDGAALYYTTDGSDPTSESALYDNENKPVINTATTIKAIAIKNEESSGIATVSYTIKKVAAPTFSPAAGEVAAGTTVELATTTDDATIHYTIDGTDPTSSSPTYSSAITINEDMTIKAIAVKDNWDDSDIASAEYTIGHGVVITGKLVTFDFSKNKIWGFPDSSVTSEKSYSSDGYSITINAPNGHKKQGSGILIGKSGATLTLPIFAFKVYKIKVYGQAGASGNVTMNFYVGDDAVSTSATSSIADHVFAINSSYQAAGNEYVFKVTNANNAQITKIEVYGMVEATFTPAKYATFSSVNKLDFTNVPGLTAYKATATSESSVTLEEVTGIVPANEGLLLKADTENYYYSYYIPVSTETATADVTGNKLQSTATAAHNIDAGEVGRAFVFGKFDDTEVGFFKAAEGKTIGVGKSYLLLDAAPAKDVEFLSFVFGDEESETTAINAVTTAVENGVRYNLAGQKVGADYKGIVIVNGKKYLRK